MSSSRIRLAGKKAFHVNDISKSYRIRGSVARIHRYIVAINIVLMINIRLLINRVLPVKKIAVSKLIIKIFAYSAIKIIANKPLLYSILNPETSSDSPSAKSNGVRFVSARLVMYHIRHRGLTITIIHEYRWFVILCISIVNSKVNAQRRIRVIDTSYEIVCATPRRAPKRAYFEFAHQPEIKMTYTFSLDTQRKYSTPNDRKIVGLLCG